METGKLTASFRGNTTHLDVVEGTPAILGRSSRCDLQVLDPSVSREHCRLLLQGRRLQVVDLDSSQGISWRGQRCREFSIDVGDGFHVGQAFVRFESTATAAVQAPGDTPPPPARIPASAPPSTSSSQRLPGDLARGAMVGGFRIDSVLGHSDRCTVYQAEQVALGRQVALKLLRPDGDAARAEVARDLFFADARAAAAVVEPFAVRVLDLAPGEGHDAFAMDLVAGESFGEILEAGRRVPWRDLVPILIEVLKGLGGLHENGQAHGAVKPSNVFLLYHGGGLIADARSTGQLRPAEVAHFAAPEQLRGQPVGPAADLFSLACVAYAALTGEAPFTGSVREVLDAQRNYAPPSLVMTDRSIPAELDELLCVKLLALDPAQRPGTGEVIAILLARGGAGGQPPPRPPLGPAALPRQPVRAEPMELRRRPAPRQKELLARLAAESIVFTIHLALVLVLLVVLKISGVNFWAWLPGKG
jgi:hypothetical protein